MPWTMPQITNAAASRQGPCVAACVAYRDSLSSQGGTLMVMAGLVTRGGKSLCTRKLRELPGHPANDAAANQPSPYLHHAQRAVPAHPVPTGVGHHLGPGVPADTCACVCAQIDRFIWEGQCCT
jgi:hypothetical protein